MPCGGYGLKMGGNRTVVVLSQLVNTAQPSSGGGVAHGAYKVTILLMGLCFVFIPILLRQ